MGFYTYQNSPSLSEANPVATQIDGFQWQVGNPALKAYTTYRIDAQLSVCHQTSERHPWRQPPDLSRRYRAVLPLGGRPACLLI